METCKITTITAVHTGSGRHLQKDTEFITGEGRAIVIDDKKVLGIIGKQNIDKWVACIDRGSSLMELVRTIKPGVEPDDLALRGMELYATNIRNSRTLKEQMLSGGDIPVIPGSSIKGSIRTAVLCQLFEQFQETPFRHEDLFNRRDKIDDKGIMSKYFGDSPNNDLLRFLTIGDALFEVETWVCNVLSMNVVNDGVRKEKSLGQLTECIPANAETEIRININQKQLDLNAGKNYLKSHHSFLQSYSSLFKMVNTHTRNLLEAEFEFWEDLEDNDYVAEYLEKLQEIKDEVDACKPGEECVLRIGHGSGWYGLTGGWAKNEKYVPDRKIWDAIENKTRPNNARYKGSRFPKTRRMDDEGYLLGFVKMSLTA